jgi:hypothetical protein
VISSYKGARAKIPGGEHGGDLVGKVGVDQRAGRDVDRDGQLPAVGVPGRGLVQGDLEHHPRRGYVP